MMLSRAIALALLVLTSWPGLALAQDVYVYPQKGQNQEQQARDQGECRSWAVGQTGFDPATAPRPTHGSSYEAQQGGLVRGGARGAATGAVIGAIGGNAGKGAAMGAAGGALIGGMRRNDQRRQQDAEYEQQVQAYNARNAEFQRAYAACLQGRGYSVN
jgi:hypothetical protein